MNIFLWTLQILAALLFTASGVMKVFLFDQVTGDVPSFGALPRPAWMILGIIELICVVLLILPSALRWLPMLTVVAATILALETLLLIWVHIQYRETGSIIRESVIGLLMAFLAYARLVLSPIS